MLAAPDVTGNVTRYPSKRARLPRNESPTAVGPSKGLTVLQTPRHYRARKARAVRYGDEAAAAEADLGLRAARIAKAIQAATAGPPLPADVIAELRALLPPTREE